MSQLVTITKNILSHRRYYARSETMMFANYIAGEFLVLGELFLGAVGAFCAWRYLSFNLPPSQSRKRHFFELGLFCAIVIIVLFIGSFVQFRATIEPGTEQDFGNDAGKIVYFGINKTTLSDASKTILDREANWLIKYPNINIVVAGNADDTPDDSPSLMLSIRRADSVKAYLVSRGVDDSRISEVGFVYRCAQVASYWENRNAVIFFVGDRYDTEYHQHCPAAPPPCPKGDICLN